MKDNVGGGDGGNSLGLVDLWTRCATIVVDVRFPSASISPKCSKTWLGGVENILTVVQN